MNYPSRLVGKTVHNSSGLKELMCAPAVRIFFKFSFLGEVGMIQTMVV